MAENANNHPPQFAKTTFEIVAIAASAGGLKALIRVLSPLPAEFTAAIAVVQHLDPYHRSLMADILNRHTALSVKQAEQGDILTPATVYIAPPNYHLLVNSNGTLSLSQSLMINFLRPCADILFESVAANYQNRAIAVVLTGTGKDGAMGVEAVKKMGGTVIVQNRETAEYPGMPTAAIQTGKVDFILPLDQITHTLVDLVTSNN